MKSVPKRHTCAPLLYSSSVALGDRFLAVAPTSTLSDGYRFFVIYERQAADNYTAYYLSAQDFNSNSEQPIYNGDLRLRMTNNGL
jgi:hypothetical protein